MSLLAHFWSRHFIALRSVYYGWWIVVGATILAVVTAGFFFIGFSAFILPLSEDLHADRGPISLGLSAATLIGAFLGPIQGYFVDRYGPRRVMVLGITLVGLGFILLSTAQTLTEYFLYVIPLFGFGMSMGTMPPAMVAVSNWFIRKRGVAFGLASTGFGLGGALVVLVQFLIETVGWRETALIIGLMFWVVGIGVASLMRHRPEQYGMLPDGDSTTGVEEPRVTQLVVPEIDFTVPEALASRSFWLLSLGFGIRGLALNGVGAHFIPVLVEKDFSDSTAAAFLAALGLLTIPSRIGFGFLLDRIEKRKVAAVLGASIALGLLFLLLGDSTWFVVPFIVFYGFGWGGTSPAMPSIRGEYFGRTNLAKINGFSMAIETTGAMVGPVFAGFTFDMTGSYDTAIVTFACFAMLSVVFIVLARRPVPKRFRVG